MPPKSHHTVPRLHLQHFAGHAPAGQVWTYDAVSGRQWSARPEETCVQTHFYSAERDDGTMDARLEEFIAKVEGRAAAVYAGLLEGRIPGEEQGRVDFAQFLALMHTRTTAMRRMAGELRGRGAQILAYAAALRPKAFEASMRRFEAETGRKKLEPDELEEVRQAMLDPSGYWVEVSKESTFMALNASDELTEILYPMKWTLMVPASGYFITSDNPLVRQVDRTTHHPVYGDGGFTNQTANVSMPLSPSLMLMLSREEAAPEHLTVPRDYVQMMNVARAGNSEQYLFAHIHDKRIIRLAQRHRDSRPAMTTDGFGPKRFAPVKVARRMKAE